MHPLRSQPKTTVQINCYYLLSAKQDTHHTSKLQGNSRFQQCSIIHNINFKLLLPFIRMLNNMQFLFLVCMKVHNDELIKHEVKKNNFK